MFTPAAPTTSFTACVLYQIAVVTIQQVFEQIFERAFVSMSMRCISRSVAGEHRKFGSAHLTIINDREGGIAQIALNSIITFATFCLSLAEQIIEIETVRK